MAKPAGAWHEIDGVGRARSIDRVSTFAANLSLDESRLARLLYTLVLAASWCRRKTRVAKLLPAIADAARIDIEVGDVGAAAQETS
jgi:hypothetical protein